MNDPTIDLICLALDASSMRQTAIAQNIANANTLNYQATEVNFEQQLSGFNFDEVKPFFQQSTKTYSIDEQIAFSIKNATQYRALIKGLNHQFALMRLALAGN